MKDWKAWGIKQRVFPDKNYNAVWHNLRTIRLGTGEAAELDYPEFYDVGINNTCNLGCPFCYVGATFKGENYKNICEKAEFFFGNMSKNERPFQIAIGSTGEPTIHPDFCDFLKTVYDLGIVPNYTTNGISIAGDDATSYNILTTTAKYVGGVAVSANTWNPIIDWKWRTAVGRLNDYGNTNINIHYIISDKASVDKFKEIYDEFKDIVLYFVLLPLMPSGRSTEKYSQKAFEYLLEQDIDFKKIAFGAHFYDSLCNQEKINCYLYPPESLSKNLLLEDTIKITRSSFDLTPIKEILFSHENKDL